jgi:hypothetical protein
MGGIQLELDYLAALQKTNVSSWGYYRMAAGKKDERREERRGEGSRGEAKKLKAAGTSK